MSTPDLTVLKETIPAPVRRGIYSTYTVLVVVASGVQVGYAAAPLGAQPTWLTIALAVLLFLGTPVGVLAAVNVQTAPAEVDYQPERALDN